jgi:predicted ATPase
MVTRWPRQALIGRRSECQALDGLLAAALSGHSGVLVLVGESGVGKTALLEYAVESASSFTVARATGVEWEMELPFATAQQLSAPMLDRLEQLPDRQRDALSVAFGLSSGETPDRFLVGLAVLSLLSETARERPLLCVVDDAQWLDRASAQTLAFVARRLLAEKVALVFAAREPEDELRGLPQLLVGGLGDRDARSLLASALRVPLDQQVRDRIVAETRGNPLALLELPQGLSSAELADGFPLSVAVPGQRRIEQSFQRRLQALPAQTQRLLLVAAAESIGDPALLWRAAGWLGIEPDAAMPAAEAELLDVGARVTFRHPLVRSAVYHAASLDERRTAHLALAEATDREAEPDRRA